MPKDKDREKEEKREKDRDKHRDRKKTPSYSLDISPSTEPFAMNPTKMEEEDHSSDFRMKDLLTDDNGRPFKEMKSEKLDPDYEPPKSLRLEPDIRMQDFHPIETKVLKPFVTTDFDTQYPLPPFAMVVAIDATHARDQLDLELKRMGLKPSTEKKYTLRELHLGEPGVFVISMGQMPES